MAAGAAAGLARPVGAVPTGPRADGAEQRPRRAQALLWKAGLAVLPDTHTVGGTGDAKHRAVQGLNMVAVEVYRCRLVAPSATAKGKETPQRQGESLR